MKMISKFFISSAKGEILISDNLRSEDVPETVEEHFKSLIKKGKVIPPKIDNHGHSFHHIIKDGLYFVAISKMHNFDALLYTEILVRFYNLSQDLCGVVSEESIRKNASSIHELLLEFMDFGYPQIVTAEKLKPHLHSKPIIFKDQTPNVNSGMLTSVNMAADSISLFGESKNSQEVFLDVVEQLSVLLNKEGRLLHAEVAGYVQLKCFLKDKPGIRIGFNKDLQINSGDQTAGSPGQTFLDSCIFHECVNTDTFAKDRVVAVNSQCGNVFSVCTYTIRNSFGISIPFRLLYTITEGHQSKDLELDLCLRCELPYNMQALNVVGKLRVPQHTTGVSSALSGPTQTVEYVSATSQVVWKLKSFPGNTEAVAKLKLIEGNVGSGSRLSLGPLALTFELSGYAVSGLKIRFLHMDSRTADKPATWIRYVTSGNSYVFRLS